MAEFERSLIQERVKAGLRKPGQGQAPGTAIEAADAGAIARLRGDGNTWNQIAATLGVGRSTLIRLGTRQGGGRKSHITARRHFGTMLGAPWTG